ncbi:MAG: hypothetical protein IJ879_02725, partial [Muribaculaceae bacterium]|nr:hypothetical protein [Muribaculaceae bacterium]
MSILSINRQEKVIKKPLIVDFWQVTLFKQLAKTKNGFEPKEIREILLQLNNVFRIMNDNNIV